MPAVYRNEQVSQEFQLLYEGSRLKGLVGFYYLDAKASTAFDVLLFTTLNNLNAFTAGDVRTDTWSVFGDFTYDFTDQLSLSLGGRYTVDKRNSTILRQTKLGRSAEFGGTPVVLATTSNFERRGALYRFQPARVAELQAQPTITCCSPAIRRASRAAASIRAVFPPPRPISTAMACAAMPKSSIS